jgi:tape measure domain-containing protein
MNLGEILIEFGGDFSRLDRDIEEAKKRAIASAKNIENILSKNISVKVDLTSLHNLNKVLDSKIAHIKQVRSEYRNPIKASISIDGDEILTSVKELKKEIQGQKISLSLSSGNVVQEIKKAIKESNIETSIRITGSQPEKNESSNIASGLKNIENAVYKSSSKKGIAGTIASGALEGLGLTIFKSVSSTLKKDAGFDISKQSQRLTSAVVAPVKTLVSDNPEFLEYLNTKSKLVDKKIRSIVYKIGDAAVSAIEDESGEKGINVFKQKLGENLNFKELFSTIRTVTEEVVDEFKKIEKFNIQSIAAFGQSVSKKPVFHSAGNEVSQFNAALFNPNIMQKITSPVDKGLRKYRQTAIEERAIPLVEARVQEILSGKRVKGQRTNYLKEIDSETKELILTIGGYAGAGGASGKLIAKDIRDQKIPGQVVNSITGFDTDVSPERLERLGTRKAMMLSMAKPNLRGFNYDAVEAAAQAVAALQKNPNLKVKALGESGGGFAAAEFYAIMQKMGYGDQSDYLGVGTPDPIGGIDPGTHRRILSPDEYLGKDVRKYAREGLANISNPNQNILGVPGHQFNYYRDQLIPEYHAFVGSNTKEQMPREKIDKMKAFSKKIQTEKASNFYDEDELNLFVMTINADLYAVREAIANAVGETRDELKQIANDIEKVVIEFNPDPEGMSSIRETVESAEKLQQQLQDKLDPQRFSKIVDVKKQLESAQSELNTKFGGEFGSVALKRDGLNQRISALRSGFSDPKQTQPKTLVNSQQTILTERQMLAQQLLQSKPLVAPKIEKLPEFNFDSEFANIKKITASFSNSYRTLKKQLKPNKLNEESKRIAQIQAQTILGNVSRAREDIEDFRSSKNIARIGSPEADKVNQRLAQLKRLENIIKRKFAKLKIELPEIDISNIVPDKEIKRIGDDITTGLSNGLEFEPVLEKIELLADKTIEQAKKTFEIQSPSKVFFRIGRYLSEGLESGIEALNLTGFYKKINTDAAEALNAKKFVRQIKNEPDEDTATANLLTSFFNKTPLNSKTVGDKLLSKLAPITQGFPNISASVGKTVTRIANIPAIRPIANKYLDEETKNALTATNAVKKVGEKLIPDAKKTANLYENIGKTAAQGFIQGLEIVEKTPFGVLASGVLQELKEMVTGFATGALSVTEFGNKLKMIAPIAKLAVGAIVGIAAYNLFGKQAIAYLNESINTAKTVESLQQRSNFSAGGEKEGNRAYSELGSQAQKFGLQKQPTIEQGVNFLSVTKGTKVQGEESLKILNSLNQASRVYNLSLDRQGRAQIALQQIVSKGVLAQEELRGQLAEAIPGATQTAARAYGVTVQELNKMIESGLDGSEFVQKFAEQLGAETGSGLAGALNTSQAVSDRFSNSLINLQESVGKAILPLQNIALTVFTGGLELINKLMPVTSVLLTVIATKMLQLTGLSLLNLVTQMGSARAGIFAMGSAIAKVGVFLKAALIQFAALAFVGSAIIAVKNSFSDLSGEIGKQVDQAKKLREEYQKIANTKPTSDQDRPNNVQQGFSRVGRAAVGFFQGKFEYKEITDTLKKIEENRKGIDETLSNVSSDATLEAIARIKIYDKELDSIQVRRRALNPGDKVGLRDLEKQEKQLLDKRSKSSNLTDNLKSQLQGQADNLRQHIGFIEKQIASYPLYSSEVENAKNQIAHLSQELEVVTQAQDKLNKAVAGGTDAFSNMRKNIKGIADDLADNTDKITIYANTQKQLLAQQSGQITPGEEQARSQQIDRESIQKQLQDQIAAFAQTQALLSTEKFQEIMSARDISFDTGKARLTTLAEQTVDPQEKYLFEQLAVLQDKKLEISKLQTQIAQSRTDAQKQLVDLTKQVADYFRGIQRNAEQQNIEMQKLSNQIKATSQQNKLRKALLDGYDNIVTQFVDSIIASIDEQKQISDRALDAQSQLLNNRNQLEDTLRSGEELRRQLPRELPPVPVEIKIPNASNNSDINQLKDQFNKALGITKDWTYMIGDANNQLADSTSEANNLTNRIEDTRRSTVETFKEITNVTLGLQNSVDKSGVLNSGISAIADKTKEVGQGFLSLPSVLETIVQQTTNWLTSLTQAPGLLGNIVQGIQGLFSTGQGQQIGQSVTNAIAGSELGQGLAQIGKDAFGIGLKTAIASPSTTQSLEQVLKGSVSKGQSFFAPRPQRGGTHSGGTHSGGTHSGIDFDNTEGLGGLAPFQAMFPGRVENLRQWGAGTRDRVTGNESNAIRIASQLPGGKGTFYTDYGHYQVPTAAVRQGQFIDAGTRLGKLSGNDNWSSGGHLDLKIMIPQSIASNFKSTLPAKDGMKYVDVKEFMNWFKSQTGTVTGNSSAASNAMIAPSKLNTKSIAQSNNLHSLLIQDIASGQTVGGYNSLSSPKSPASTIKVIVADLLINAVKEGRIDAAKQLTLKQNEIAEGSSLKSGQKISVSEALTKMLKDSDNTSTNALINLLGGTKNVTRLANQSGYKNTSIGNLLSIPGSKGFSNISTPEDLSSAMVRILKDPSAIAQTAENALRQTRNFKFQGEAGGKIGNNSKIIGNVGIVSINGKEYVVTAFAEANGNIDSNKDIIRKATNDVVGAIAGNVNSRSRNNAIATLQGAKQSQLPAGKYANKLDKLSPEFIAKSAQIAKNLGTTPENLLAVMGFETGGTFSPSIRNSLGYTGLIQFSPKYSPKTIGKTTNQLAKMSQIEQLDYVEKYINANRRGKSVASLEDLYMSVLMPSHIGRGGNAKLPGWAYRANKGLDIDRDGAISVSEATQKARDYYRPLPGRQVLNAANNFRSATPGQLQGGITAGQDLARSQSEQQNTLIQQQLNADLEKAQQEFLRRNNQALRQFERSGRDLRDQQQTSGRELEDLAAEANKNPTYRQRANVDIRGINRRYDDAIRDRERNIQDRSRQVTVAEKSLTEGGLSVEQGSALQRQLADDKAAIAQFEKEIADLKTLRDEAIKNSEELFGREENIRRQQAGFDITRAKIEQARQALEDLNLLQQKSPLDPRVKQIPALQEYLDTEEALLSAKEKELQFNEQLFKNDITPDEFKAKSDALKEETEQRIRNAKARREQAEAEANLQEVQRKAEVRSQLLQVTNDSRQLQIQLRQLGRGTGDSAELQRLIDISNRENEFANKRFEIQSAKNRTPEEKQQMLGSLDSTESLRRQLEDAQYARTREDNAFSIQERLNQSRQELLGSRSSLMRNVGGSSRDLDRQAALEQQGFSYKSALREIERFAQTSDEAAQAAVQLRANLEQVNQVKLQDIKTQFDPLTDAFKSAQSGLQGFLTSVITGSESIGDAFRKMVASLAENLANLATQLLTQELFGGLFGGNKKGNDSGGWLGNILGGGQKSSGGGGNWISGLLGIFGGLFADGGMVPNFASGGAIANISQSMLKEQMATGRKPYLIVASEGERVLNHRETQIWEKLNRGGVPNFAAGGVVGMPSASAINTNNSPVSINVSVASNGDVSADAGDRGNKLASELKQSVIGIIINEQRPGGSLYGGR